MATKLWNVALLGFAEVLSRRLGMVLAEKIKKRPEFAFQSDWQKIPCDAVVIDAATQPAAKELADLRKKWPGAITVWVSDSGTAGDSEFKIDRANLFVKLRPMLEQAMEEAAIDGGQMPDNKLVPDANRTHVGTNSASKSLSALIVDDSSTVRAQVNGALARIGFIPEEATTGEMALTKAKLKAYDLFLIDIDMPGMDGYTLIKKINELPDRIRVPMIILSSRGSAFDKVRGALAGSENFLTKPVNLKDLVIAIDKAMMKFSQADRARLAARGYRVST
jgi:two-component system, cell cycle response regulator